MWNGFKGVRSRPGPHICTREMSVSRPVHSSRSRTYFFQFRFMKFHTDFHDYVKPLIKWLFYPRQEGHVESETLKERGQFRNPGIDTRVILN